MVRQSAFRCPVCGQKTMKVYRTLSADETRRVRYYVCMIPGCTGTGSSEEIMLAGKKDADVQKKVGQPEQVTW